MTQEPRIHSFEFLTFKRRHAPRGQGYKVCSSGHVGRKNAWYVRVGGGLRRVASRCCVLAGCIAAGLAGPAAAQDQKWSAWSEFGGAYKSDDASRGSVTLFAPLMQGPRDLLFIDARGKLFEDSAKEGNLALAYRQMLSSGWNLGAWVGGDLRGTALNNSFWQLSGGVEALSENFDLRLNGYGPISAPQAAGANSNFTQVVLAGSNIYMIGGREVGLRGVDGEVGVRLPTQMLSLDPEKFELRAYGGAFYFDHEAAINEVAGPKARLELRINDIIPGMPGSRLTADYAYSHDEVREHRHEIGARLRVPLGSPETWTRYAGLTAQEQRMMDGLERDVDVVVVRSEAEPVEDAITNVDFDRVAYVNSGGSVTSTATAAGANSLIIATGGTHTGEQFLQDSQTLQSGASTIAVRGLYSGTVASFTAPFSQTTLTNSSQNVVNLVSNTHLNGFIITKTGSSQDDAVVARDAADNDGFSNFAITNNDITTYGDGSNAIGIDDDNDTVWVAGNTLLTNGEEAQGIELGDDNTNVAFAGNTITTTADDAYGIEVHYGNSNVSVIGNTVTTEEDFADGIGFVGFNDNIVVSGNTVDTHEYLSNGIFFGESNTNVSVSANTVTTRDDGADGIGFGADNRFITVTGNTVTTEDDDALGLAFYEGNRDVTVSANTVTTHGEESDGIFFGEENRDIAITGNTVTANGAFAYGVTLLEDNVDAVVDGNDIRTTGEDGLGVYLGFGNRNVTISNNEVGTEGEFGSGIILGFANVDVDVIGNTVITEGDFADAIGFGAGQAGAVVSNNVLTTSGLDANGIYFGPANSATISGNTFTGSIGGVDGDVLDVNDGGNVLNGSGNTIAPGTSVGGVTCQGRGNFAGTVTIDGVDYTGGGTNCAP